jgi:hypothetical protein
MSAHEFREWAEFYGIEPWGWEANCFASGIVAATIAEVNRDHKKRQKPYSPVDFVPQIEPRKVKPIDGRALKAQLQAVFAPQKAILDARANKLQNSRRKRNGSPAEGAGSSPSRKGRGRSPASRSKANHRRSPKISPEED